MVSGVYSPKHFSELYQCFDPYNLKLFRLLGTSLRESPQGILDCACGVGLSTSALACTFPDALVVGFDVAPHLIFSAKRRYAGGSLHFFVADCHCLSAIQRSRRLNLLVIKSAYHLLENQLPLESLLDSLTPGITLAIFERTERSAASYPLFLAASSYWRNYFSTAREDRFLRMADTKQLEFFAYRFGQYLSLPPRAYLNAIRTGQLSFLWEFRSSVIENWISQYSARPRSEIMVYEEFNCYCYRRSSA